MSHVVSGPGLRAEVHADRGARIVSLRSDDGFEWLLPSVRTSQAGVGQSFVRTGMGGWDEVAPSVQADPDFLAGQNIEGSSDAPLELIPDHGDIWNAPWTVEQSSPAGLVLSVQLLSLPIHLERSITVTALGLRLSYTATTTSAEPVPFLWCAHPQFVASEGTAVSLEVGGTLIDPLLHQMYPQEGLQRSFPPTPLHRTLAAGTSVKAFVDPGFRVDAAVLKQPSGHALRLSWDAGVLPYLGLFWDNGEFAPAPVLAIEPSTGWGERLSTAVNQGRVLFVAQDQPLQWFLDLSA